MKKNPAIPVVTWKELQFTRWFVLACSPDTVYYPISKNRKIKWETLENMVDYSDVLCFESKALAAAFIKDFGLPKDPLVDRLEYAEGYTAYEEITGARKAGLFFDSTNYSKVNLKKGTHG